MLRRGYGHCTLLQKSSCIDGVVRGYFVEGKVPAKDSFCDWDRELQPIIYGDGEAPAMVAEGDQLDLPFAAQDLAAFARGKSML